MTGALQSLLANDQFGGIAIRFGIYSKPQDWLQIVFNEIARGKSQQYIGRSVLANKGWKFKKAINIYS